MKLIDADKLIDSLRGNVLIDVTPDLEEAVMNQPTVLDVTNILEELAARINIELQIIANVSDPRYEYGFIKSVEAYQQCRLILENIIQQN